MDAPVAHHAAGVVEVPAEEQVEPVRVERRARGGAEPAVVVDVRRGVGVGVLAHAHGADVLEVPGLDPEDLAELPRADDLDGLLEVRRGPLLGADGHDLVRLPRGPDHRLALGDVVGDRLLDVDVLAGQHRLDRGQGMPVVGRGDDHARRCSCRRASRGSRAWSSACCFLSFLMRSAVSPACWSSTSATATISTSGCGRNESRSWLPRLPAPIRRPDLLVCGAGRGDRGCAQECRRAGRDPHCLDEFTPRNPIRRHDELPFALVIGHWSPEPPGTQSLRPIVTAGSLNRHRSLVKIDTVPSLGARVCLRRPEQRRTWLMTSDQ